MKYKKQFKESKMGGWFTKSAREDCARQGVFYEAQFGNHYDMNRGGRQIDWWGKDGYANRGRFNSRD
jgi:hypothetical protein